MSLFEHKDNDDDEIEVKETHSNQLSVDVTQCGESSVVYLDRDAAARLRDALTGWLGEGSVSTEPMTEERVRAIVSEAVAILPLHLSPLASAFTYSRPESDDVGHPADDLWGIPCTRCGHLSGVHSGKSGCHAVVSGPLGEHCGCSLDSAVAVSAPEPEPVPQCTRCGAHYDLEPNGDRKHDCVVPVVPEAPKSSCTCHKHRHVLSDRFMCAAPGCFCPNAGKRVQS